MRNGRRKARRWNRRLLLLGGALIVFVAAWFLALPSPLDAAKYHPPPAPPMAGAYRPNHTLRQAAVVGRGGVIGAEDVDADGRGGLVGGVAAGAIVRWDEAAARLEVLAETGGRPLGLDWDAAGNLIICDAFRGLLRLTPAGELDTLLTEVAGVPLGFANDVEVAADGAIYFSDASTRFDQKHYLFDMLEARPWGRLIRYRPEAARGEVLLDGLYFANGVALSERQDFVLVNETYRYRITRYWLAGPKAGRSEVFIDNLPGFPDGISRSGRGTFWLALPTLRHRVADALHPHPFWKEQLAKLPSFAHPRPEPYGLVLELDEHGAVLRSLHDPGGNHFAFITSAQQRGETLYLGTLMGDGIGVLALDALP